MSRTREIAGLPGSRGTVRPPQLDESLDREGSSGRHASGSLILDDTASTAAPGQMRKAEFLARLRSALVDTVGSGVGGGWSVEDCPWIEQWLAVYRERDAAHGEAVLRRYTRANPERAEDFIPLVCARVLRAVRSWSVTGELSELPEEGGAAAPEDPNASTPQLKERGSAGATPAPTRGPFGGGSPLDASVRGRMESAFSTSFDDVRVHTGGEAHAMSDRHDARALTVGPQIVFGHGEYRPGTLEGDALLAHELAHVVQQRGAAPSSAGSERLDLEHDADSAAVGAVGSLWGLPVGGSRGPALRSGLGLQRCGRRRFGPTIGRTTTTIPETTSPFGAFDVVHGADSATQYYLQIEMTPNARTANADEIAFLQAYRRGTRPGSWSRLGPSTGTPDPFMDATRERITDPATGWAADKPFATPTYSNTPFYGITQDTAGVHSPAWAGLTRLGKFGGARPMLYDAPGIADPYAIEFTSCAVCEKAVPTVPSERWRSYGCISWGFVMDSSTQTWREETPSFSLQDPHGAQTGRAAGLESGLNRWNSNVAGGTIEAASMPFATGATVAPGVTGGSVLLRTVVATGPSTGSLQNSTVSLTPGTQMIVLQRSVTRNDADGTARAMAEVMVAGQVGWLPVADLVFVH